MYRTLEQVVSSERRFRDSFLARLLPLSKNRHNSPRDPMLPQHLVGVGNPAWDDASTYITAWRRQGSAAFTDVRHRCRNRLWGMNGYAADKLCVCGSLILARDFIEEMPDRARGILDHGSLHR